MAIKDFDSDCWGDPWFQERNRLARYLFIYLWTNSHCNVAGLYVITKKTICDETQFTPAELDKFLGQLEPKVKYDPERSVCWVVKHARRQFLKSEKISEQTRKGIRKAALRLCYHSFFPQFIDAYPEIFDPEEKEALYRPPTGGLGGSIDPPVQVKVRYRSGFKEEGVQGEEGKKEPDPPPEREKRIEPAIKRCIDFYFDQFQGRFGEKPLIEGGKDGALMKSLLKEIPEPEVKELMKKFFESSDPFVVSSGYTIGVFKSQINKLRIGKAPPADEVDRRIFEIKKERERHGHSQPG